MLHGDESTDKEIRELAQLEGRIIISKDTDFYYAHMTLGEPQKLLLITTGNITNKVLLSLIRKYMEIMDEHFHHSSFIELSNEGILVHG